MCAIAGVIGLQCTAESIRNMISTMQRRGPDGSGCECDNEAVLLHTRLAIIDPQGGKQPMTLQWNREVYTIIYNGELYNTEELRATLKSEGHTFSGHSDTEVLLHAYVQWGTECLHKINGIFAFAVWERSTHRLFIARDRIGVKPLFFARRNGGFLFASELKTILAYPDMPAEIDREGAWELLMLGPGRMPGSGVFKGISELKPGHFAVYQNDELMIREYWRLRDREHTEDFEQTAAHVRYLVTDAIKRQTVSDVPVGTFLSGGLDSSIITAVCAKDFAARGKRLPTFSVDYTDNALYFKPNKFQPTSDNNYIEIMEHMINADAHHVVLNSEQLISVLEEATYARDLPGMADVDFSLLLFSGQIREHVKVALSGECADEIFGGYPWYRDPSVLSQNGFPWAQNTHQRAALLAQEIYTSEAVDFVEDQYLDTIRQCDVLPGTSEAERRMKQMIWLNHCWFMQTLLDRKDRMSMFHGLEVRVPFCDYRIAEYLYSVPWTYKNYRNTEKGLLRYAVRDLLPEEVLWRKKSPYPKTHDPKYTQLVKAQLQAVISHKNAPLLQLVRKDSLESIINGESPWPWYGQLMRIPQTIAYMLQLNLWLEKYKVNIVL